MAYLTDTEKRILFSALAREEKVCKTMDRLEKPKGTPLVKIVESLRKKFYYDRFEKEIRAKAIDEFAERLKSDEFQKYNLDMVFETSRNLSYTECIDAFQEYVDEIAEQMKGGAK